MSATLILARASFSTETIEAVMFDHIPHGSFHYAVCIRGGKHDGCVTRCHTEQSAIALFTEAVAARKAKVRLWWLERGE